MDALFVFIFYLLHNVQVAEFYQIGADTPVTKKIGSDIPPKNSQLRAVITAKGISITQGASESLIAKYSWSAPDLEKLKSDLLQLKKKYASDESFIIRPSKKLEYKKIVQVIDRIQQPYNDAALQKKLFNSIAFEDYRDEK
jgi:biopolymer transport protein ExbD